MSKFRQSGSTLYYINSKITKHKIEINKLKPLVKTIIKMEGKTIIYLCFSFYNFSINLKANAAPIKIEN